MLTEKYIRTEPLSTLLSQQGASLLRAQGQIATAYYRNVSGQLESSLSKDPQVNGLKMSISYPTHIRFLDMKKGTGGKKKGNYEPIYNKYVYGFLFAGIYRRLTKSLSGMVRSTIVKSLNNE